jgi:hypothetical protein
MPDDIIHEEFTALTARVLELASDAEGEKS